MSEFISKFGLTAISLAVIFAWAYGANKKFKAAVDKDPFGDYEQPQTASVLGVLGTFFGISIGLINFNPAPDAMQQSVINLLGGMTTAFFTSIVGMGISLYFKNYQTNAQKNFHGTKSDSTTADLISYLKKADDKRLQTLREEFKNLRDTLNTNNARVIDEFKNFGKTLAESNSKAFMDALTDAIKDFNQKMAEQFGENFKQFNVAVGRLLVWQENYKTTLETITHNLQIIIKGIDELRISIEQIENSAASMTESSEQIQNLILTANLYEQKLEQVLIQVQTLGESSQAAVPSIVEFVKSSCEEMQSYTEQATQDVNSYVSTVSRKYSDEIKTYTEQATQNINSQVNAVVDNLESKMKTTINQTDIMAQNVTGVTYRSITAMEELSKKLNNNFEKTKEMAQAVIRIAERNMYSMQQLSEELHRESSKIITDTNEKMNQMMKTNDENLKTSLETLGTAMLKISGKFVEDYTPLVNELKKIVEIAKQVRLPAKGGGTLF